jgi:glutamate/tyrosine decarboxylase-like PLP-dependent enzyme
MENNFDEQQSYPHLTLSREQMRTLGYQVVDMLVEHFEQVGNLPVTRKETRLDLETRLREPVPRHPSDASVVLERVQRDVLDSIMHLDHPRCFAFVPGPGNFVSAMADALASGFNVFAGTWLEASGPTQIELVTLDWLRQFCGLPDTAGGLFVSGGSVANLTALATARHIMLRDDITNAIVYCSDQTHSSVARALRILGFPASQVRLLPTDEQFRLRLDDVRDALVQDRNTGKRPFCVVASAGTTSTGAIDPLDALADLCRDEHLWLHVDGAYGAAAMLSKQGRQLLKGIERAHSLSLDPHKWLFQPYEMGGVLVQDAHWLKETFHILPEYLKDIDQGAEEVNFCDYGIQLTRGTRALKLWMSLHTFGLDAFREAIEHGIMLAEYAETVLRSSPLWELVTPAQIGIITFRYVPVRGSVETHERINQQLIDALIRDGFAMLSSTILHGRTTLRLCTINPRTTREDIQATIERLEFLGATLL